MQRDDLNKIQLWRGYTETYGLWKNRVTFSQKSPGTVG